MKSLATKAPAVSASRRKRRCHPEVKNKAFKQAKEEAEEDAEPRYGGVFKAKELPAECHSRCVKPWKEYEKCEARIEKAGEGNCASWYSDYVHCVDTCGAKVLFATLR
ncbi:hypothetical protein EMIHUDRAFT_208577 [Emiliania huxleyi CCMP1516]|uniref:Ubiquinol-cytochrome C reductase hinge domain-containing protein n=2 Tax=Emiliania huxleyi TaxID=2903 RepID=A0A0D3JAT4_EMIH1|nr:hypothetical protein EMIHUDRAFT_208577 [Emiliania huxleyi CCMP1516]EOD20619.1 hypothetical protein EMIHUDRAFT_208577 [Emiliania huxleyi CCMP1516]|eukprot:XP_005773048.1 hypothetical protein EMIHUDRAFT_208577 [Emiliania huxleyi CCMP1516]